MAFIQAKKMKKNLSLLVTFLLLTYISFAQNIIEWNADYQLKPEDFQGKAVNKGQMQSVSGSFSVSYEMGGINVITTRNLNKNVSATFQKDASYIHKGNEEATHRLVRYQQLIFNLYELQARKLRKKFFEERAQLLTKGPSKLHQQVYAEHTRLLSEVEADTFHGSSSQEIEKWNTRILQEIEKLNDFCKACKPRKKKK